MRGVKLDRIDRRILRDLQADGRMTNVQLAERAGISAPPCLRRVRALERAEVIRGYHADVSPTELGYNVTVFAQVYWALLPCAGTGSRAVVGPATVAALPKQYQSVAGQPMVLHTLAAFAGVSRLRGTLVAVAPGDHFLDAYPSATHFTVDCGGPTRADTVLGGLRALQARGARAQDWVLVHDLLRAAW